MASHGQQQPLQHRMHTSESETVDRTHSALSRRQAEPPRRRRRWLVPHASPQVHPAPPPQRRRPPVPAP
eukprot:3807980-Prymnesium_polylepis.1